MSTSHDDLIERSAYIHWPDRLDPDTADLFAHNAIVIDAATESTSTAPPATPARRCGRWAARRSSSTPCPAATCSPG